MAQVQFLVAVLLVVSLCAVTALSLDIPSLPSPLPQLLLTPPPPSRSPPPPPRSPPPPSFKAPPPMSPASPPFKAPPPMSPPAPWCPVYMFQFLDVKPLMVSCHSGIDARIWIRYYDEGLVEAGSYQLPSKGKPLGLNQQIQVTTSHPFCVDFLIKCGSTRVFVTASVNLSLAKKIAKPTGEKSACGEPLYCIELNLVMKGKFYEVYSGETLIVKKKF